MTCTDCISAQGASKPDDDLQRNWVRRVRYFRSCVEAEATGEPVARSATGNWLILPTRSANLIAYPGDELTGAEELGSFAARLAPAKELQYGWPTLVLADAGRVDRIVPLFIIGIDSPAGPAQSTGATDEEPFLNPALADIGTCDPEALAGVDEMLAGGIPLGDYAALNRLARTILDTLGLASVTPERPNRFATGF